MAARRPFWKWHRWKSTCIWNLKLKFQSKLDLCSGNHVVYRQTDRRTDGRTRWIQYTPPPTSLGGGIIKTNITHESAFPAIVSRLQCINSTVCVTREGLRCIEGTTKAQRYFWYTINLGLTGPKTILFLVIDGCHGNTIVTKCDTSQRSKAFGEFNVKAYVCDGITRIQKHTL